MTIVPKLVLHYARDAGQDENGDPQPGWYFEYHGTGIFNPYYGIGHDEAVDPVTYYGITPEQADQLCILNGVSK